MDINGAAAKLTHVNYAFGFVNGDGDCYSADAWADWQRPMPPSRASTASPTPRAGAERQPQPAEEAQGQAPGLKALISLGGWTGSKYFSDAVLTPRGARQTGPPPASTSGSRATCPAPHPVPARASSTASTSTGSGPVPAGKVGNVIRPEDKRNFTLFVTELRRSSSEERSTRAAPTLTAFLPAAAAKIDAGFEVHDVCEDLASPRPGLRPARPVGGPSPSHNGNLLTDPARPQPVKFSASTDRPRLSEPRRPGQEDRRRHPGLRPGWTGVTGSATASTAPPPAPRRLSRPPDPTTTRTWSKNHGKRYRDLLTPAPCPSTTAIILVLRRPRHLLQRRPTSA